MKAPHFNALCKAAEAQFFDNIKGYMAQARLFYFDKNAEDFVPRKLTQETADSFVLPFPVCAVEDPENIVLIVDLNEGEDRIGTAAKRLFVVYETATIGIKKVWGIGFIEVEGAGPINDYKFTLGKILNERYFTYVDGKFDCLKPDDPETSLFYATWNMKTQLSAFAALHELIYALEPSKFIFETTPKKNRKVKNGKFPRSHERPVYSILNPGEIRREMKLPDSDSGFGNSKAPHERRGHWRIFRSERYKNVRGQKKWIEPIWIGPSEGIVGNKKYKVRLDL